MSVLGSIATILMPLVPKIFRKKPFVLWFWDQDHWTKQGIVMSARQCRKTMAVLVSMGMSEFQFRILREGATPPPYFDPPQVKSKRGK